MEQEQHGGQGKELPSLHPKVEREQRKRHAAREHRTQRFGKAKAMHEAKWQRDAPAAARVRQEKILHAYGRNGDCYERLHPPRTRCGHARDRQGKRNGVPHRERSHGEEQWTRRCARETSARKEKPKDEDQVIESSKDVEHPHEEEAGGRVSGRSGRSGPCLHGRGPLGRGREGEGSVLGSKRAIERGIPLCPDHVTMIDRKLVQESKGHGEVIGARGARVKCTHYDAVGFGERGVVWGGGARSIVCGDAQQVPKVQTIRGVRELGLGQLEIVVRIQTLADAKELAA